MRGENVPEPRPRVSVVMAAYNSETTIGAAISGVLHQTWDDVEVIVVDDGSTDRTGAICRGYGDLIRYIRRPNGGTAAARNTGIAVATGTYLAFCDSDDVLLPPYLAKNMEILQQAPSRRHLVMNEAFLLTDRGTAHGRRLIHGRFPHRAQQRMAILRKNFVCIFAVFPRRLVDEIGGFDESLRYCEDWDFWLRAVLHGWEVIHQPVPHAMYRWSPDAKSGDMESYEAEDEIVRRVREEYADRLTADELHFLDLRLKHSAPRLLELRGGDAVRARDWATAQQTYRVLQQLSSGDRRTWAKATVLGWVPFSGPVWKRRQDRIEAAIGRREMKQRS